MPDRYLMKQISSDSSDTYGLSLYRVPLADSTEVGDVDVAPKATSQVVQSVVSSLIVCNTDNLSGTISVATIGSLTTSIFYKVSMDARETKVFNVGVTLSAGDYFWIASTRGYDWSLMGIETTEGTGPDA